MTSYEFQEQKNSIPISTYLILGASSDVGKAFLSRLNSEGETAIVYAHYANSNEALLKLSKDWNNLDMRYIKADLSDDRQVDELIETIVGDSAEISHIVHLAALPFKYMKLKQWDEEHVKTQMQVSVYSFARICKTFLPSMAKRKSGKVLAMLSSFTLGVPPKFMSDYVLVKHALLGFVKAIAVEYGDKGISINAISPNMMETKFLADVDLRLVEMTAASSALGRNVAPQEVAEGMMFLLSKKNSYMNGVNLNMSGGDRM